MIPAERVAFVWSDEVQRGGSGYVIRCDRGDVVLTAAHVVTGVERCVVRLHGQEDWLAATVIWRDEAVADVAVLAFDEALDFDLGDEPDWATCRNADLEARAIGYPRFQRPKGRADTEEFVGKLRPGSGLESKRLNLVDPGPAREPKAWKGMSGAALFADGLLIGVVTQADDGRLLAWPVARLLEQADFAATVGASLADRLQHDALWPETDRGAIDCILDWTALRRPRLQQPGQLLRANYEVVPFADDLRGLELEQLEAFTQGSEPWVAIVTGPGGSGKTRLLLEWCKRMRAEHWLAGFVDLRVPDLRPAAKGQTPRLLVIDYAETEVERTLELIHALLRERGRPKTRLVLLARHRGPWVDALRQDDRAAQLLDAALSIQLQPPERTQRVDTYRAAYLAFAGHEPSDLLDVGDDEDRPLLTHMRALLAVLDGADRSHSRAEVVKRIIDHERQLWRRQLERRLGKKLSDSLLAEVSRVGAALVLVDGVSAHSGVPGLVRRVTTELAIAEVEALSACFSALYSRGSRVVGLDPDLLGEQLVLETLAWDEDNRGPEALTTWLALPFETNFEGAISRTLTVLTRLAANAERDEPRARSWLAAILRERGPSLVEKLFTAGAPTDPPGSVLADAILAANDMPAAMAIDAALPERTVELREVAWATASVIVAARRLETGEDASARLANSLSKLGNRLNQLGRFDEALDTAQQVVATYRKLVAVQSESLLLVDLAMALHNLGAMLHDSGRPEDALNATQEAVDIHRQLAEIAPSIFLPDLANSLNSLGLMLLKLGRREDALDAGQEAVDIRQQLADGIPDAIFPDLAVSLSNLGLILQDLGRLDEALDVLQKAVESYRQLALLRPDAFRPDLAAVLTNLGGIFHELDRREDALDATQQALDIRRQLADVRPDPFLPDLAMSLNNFGTMLAKSGRREEALEITKRSVDIYEQLVEARPDAFLPDLARSFHNLGAMLHEMGRCNEALDATQRAVTIRRQLAHVRPDSFLSDLVASLNSLEQVSIMLREVGRREHALNAAEQVVDTYAQLAETMPDTFLPDLALNLNNLGMMLGDLDRLEEALDASQRAVSIYERLAGEKPDDFLLDFATSLGAQGRVLLAVGQSSVAAAAYAAGLRAVLQLAEAQPHAAAHLFVRLTHNYRQACRDSNTEIAEDLAPYMAPLDQPESSEPLE